MTIPRRVHFFVARPFYRKLLATVETHSRTVSKYDAKIAKVGASNKAGYAKMNLKLEGCLNAQSTQNLGLKSFMGQHEARQMDFDAILHRLGFIEGKLRESENRLHEIANQVGPLAKLTLDDRTNEVMLPEVALAINHTRYGNFILRTPDVVGDFIRAGGFWDEHLHDLIIRHSDKEAIAVDAGAYVGFHSCFMARYFGKVISFEPQPVIFRMLAANFLLNGHENVEIHNSALYDRECLMRIADPEKQEIPVTLKDNQVDYSILSNAGALAFEVTEPVAGSVQAYPLDSLNLNNVKFIKIDTQGCDLKVLLGARETILRCRPVVVYEFEHELSEAHQSPRSEYERFFEEVGYKIHLIRSHENKQFDFYAVPS